MLSLFKHELFSRWGAMLGWSIALAAFGVMYVAIYPEFEDKLAVLADISFYRTMGIDLGSFEGFMASSLVLNIPVMLSIYIIVTSTGTLAGEDDSGTLELLVTTPLKRWHIVTMKAAALVVVTFVILAFSGACSAFALAWMNNFVAVDVTPTQLFIAVLSGWPVTLAVLMIGLFFSAFLPNRRTASVATAVVFIVGYLGEPLAANVESLDFVKPFLLFHYFDSSAKLFSRGLQAGDAGVLLGVAAFFFGLTLLSFQYRDVTVGQWPWQRAVARQALK